MSFYFAEAVRRVAFDGIRVEWPATGWIFLKCNRCGWHIMAKTSLVEHFSTDTKLPFDALGLWVRRHAICK